MNSAIPSLFRQNLKDNHFLIVGGGSGMGKATAHLASALGASVTIASRDRSKLEQAAASISKNITIAPVDMTNEASVKSWASTMQPVDHLIITASSAAHGKFTELPMTALQHMFEAKFFGPYRVVREMLPIIKANGSVTLFSGVLSRRPGTGASGLAAVNAAVESLVGALAAELGKQVRVNGISPGMVRTEAYAAMDAGARETMFTESGQKLPVGRVGEPMDIAQAVLMVATNPYINGAIIDADGGYLVS